METQTLAGNPGNHAGSAKLAISAGELWGSNDYPEGICLPSSDPDLAEFKSDCLAASEPTEWCGT